MSWRDLPAGPELDALVAERVLGWSNCHIGLTYRKAMGIPPEMLAKQPPGRTIGCAWQVVDYSQAIGCAWQVVEAMRSRGWLLSLLSESPHGGLWTAEFELGNRNIFGPPSVGAPLAICRAALSALEAQS